MNMRLLCLMILFTAISVRPSTVNAFTTVTLSTSAPLSVEKKFIELTTTYFTVGLFVNPLASNTYAIKLFGTNPPVTVLGNSFDECIATGYADGMENERTATIGLIQSFQRFDVSSGTCMGVVVSTTAFQACQLIYDNLGIAIMDRWGFINTP